ncbi:hypothetical protein Moror_12193 [Moniliophthora roreri MCA 2997]|uniref:Uncharacterized protein n=2 Tax=Moniliophthora roreri TaxID=221103 RepID=V2WP98_MONRO|nr:hypothetical protein Moror_12193 [Moniliophthora roreri MCA 2997]
MVNVEEIDVEGSPFDSYTSEGDSSVEAGVGKISLPSLRRLRVPVDCASIFKRCHIPGLEDLTLTHTRYMNECPLLTHLSTIEKPDDDDVTMQLPTLRRIYISHLTAGLADSLLAFLLSPVGAGIEKLAFGTWAVSGLEKVLTFLASSGCRPSSNSYCVPRVLPGLRVLELGGNLMEGGVLGRLGEVHHRLTVKAKRFHEYPQDIGFLLHRLRLDIQD